MSLKDTIRGAREEVAASGNPFENVGKGKATADGGASGAQQSGSRGYARRSAANRKPSREAAAGVRVVNSSGKSKSKAHMTKEERKEERNRERENEDRRYSVEQMILEQDEVYQKSRKMWWRFLIGGFAFLVIALALYSYVTGQADGAPMWMYGMSIGSMVLAYAIIICGMVYDWRKVRPRRKEAERRVASMTDKKVQTIVNRGSL
jgi:hypothetical protein